MIKALNNSNGKFASFILQPKTIIGLYIILALVATLQSYLMPQNNFAAEGYAFTYYNNYVIFKESVAHLFNHTNLYTHYLTEHFDLYKYSPTFALLFSPFYILPDIIGLFVWNLLNAFVLLYALYKLPGFAKKRQSMMLLFVLIELMTAMQNEQSNGLIAGLLILSFTQLERGKYLWGTLSIVSTVFIKLFGIVAFAILLFYPKKWKLALYSLGWTILLTILPGFFVGFEQLGIQYSNWLALLQNDHSVSYGFSVMGWLHSWFGLEINKIAILAIGVVLFCLPLFKYRHYSHYAFRIQILASILLWIVIFNHKAESPTFIIAASGVALWYYTQKKTIANFILIILAFIFTILSPTDIFPHYVRHNIFVPYAVKAVPCILIWVKLIYDLMANKYTLHPDTKTNK